MSERVLEDFYQGIFCGFCGSRGPCSHDYNYPSETRQMPDERPDPRGCECGHGTADHEYRTPLGGPSLYCVTCRKDCA